MKCLALACDYDGTLAHDGLLDDATAAALDRFRASGRRLLMVTGRELPDLQKVCQVLDKFDWIVAENGALLYRPSDHFSQLLCAPASAAPNTLHHPPNSYSIRISQETDCFDFRELQGRYLTGFKLKRLSQEACTFLLTIWHVAAWLNCGERRGNDLEFYFLLRF